MAAEKKEVLMVPKNLRTWFVIHFIADYLFGIPLLLAPVWTLTLVGWSHVDPATTRLVGAALLGIGGESLLGRNASLETFKAMLNLKIIWSLTAIFGISMSIIEGAPLMSWGFLGIFVTFSAIWVYYRIKIRVNIPG
jgi:hypothetical protein